MLFIIKVCWFFCFFFTEDGHSFYSKLKRKKNASHSNMKKLKKYEVIISDSSSSSVCESENHSSESEEELSDYNGNTHQEKNTGKPLKEQEILRDANYPNIYIRRVLKDKHRKSAHKKERT